MRSKILVGLCLLSFIYKIEAASASFITKCKWDDSKCIKQSTQAAIPIFTGGIPELNVEQLDPIKLKNLDASSPNMKLLLNDISGTGLKDCVAKKMQRDKEKSKLFVKLLCNVDLTAKYEMDGLLLVLPIQGKGDAHVVLRKMQLSAELDMTDKEGEDGSKHWFIKDYKYSYELKDKATVELENLFNGNEVLARAARELFASNPNEIVVELGPPIVKAVIQKIVKNINNLFAGFKINELEE